MAPRKSRKPSASSHKTAQEPPASTPRKRRLSSSSDAVLDTHEDESSTVTSPAARKRQRNDKRTAKRKSELRAEELQAAIYDDDTGQDEQESSEHTPGAASDRADHQTPEKHVHFATANHVNAPDELGQREGAVKMSVKRRKTTSPHDGLHKNRLRLAAGRASLPDRTGILESTTVMLDQPIRYTPLREMIDQRKQLRRSQVIQQDESCSDHGSRAVSEQDDTSYWIQMARDEERIRALQAELVSGRRDDDTIEHMTSELHALQRSLPRMTSSGLFNKDSDDLLIADVDDTSNTPPAPEVDEEDNQEQEPAETSSTPSTRYWGDERIKLQDAVLALSQQVNDIKGRWRLHEIALQSLGFSDEENTGDQTITAIGDAFRSLRAAVASVCSSDDTSRMSNAEVVQTAIKVLDTFSIDSSLLGQQLADRNKLTSELRAQIDSLVERIADSENELERVKKQRSVLLKQADEYDSHSRKAATEVEMLKQEREAVEDQLSSTQDDLDQARSTIDQLRLTAERYKTSLQGYRAEEERLQTLITRMEEEHFDKVAAIDIDHKSELDRLASRLNEEGSACRAAKTELCNAREQVVQLDDELATARKERDSVLNKLQELDEELQSECNRREQAEASIQVRSSEAEQLQGYVESLEAQLVRFKQSTLDLQAQYELECEQRLFAESKLIELGETSATLEAHLHSTVERLEEQIDELQLDFDSKLGQRDEQLGENQRAIEVLSQQVEEAENVRLEMIDRAKHKQIETDTMSRNLRKTDETAERALSQADAAIASQQAEIEKYKDTIASYEAQIADLEAENASLEHRVEGEAEQMLQTQADKLDELDELRNTLVDKQNKILVIEAKARQTDQRWQDLLNHREHELEHAQASLEEQNYITDSLRQDLDALRAEFSDYAYTAQLRTCEISSALVAAETIIREECAALDAAGRVYLDPASDSHHVATKRNSRIFHRREHDSGIGVASDEADTDPIAI